jgi:hypothetical protein
MSAAKIHDFVKQIACRSSETDRYEALFMRKITPLLVVGLCGLAFYPRSAEALILSAPKPKFTYKDASGKKQSVEVVDKYQRKKIVRPLAKIDSKIVVR